MMPKHLLLAGLLAVCGLVPVARAVDLQGEWICRSAQAKKGVAIETWTFLAFDTQGLTFERSGTIVVRRQGTNEILNVSSVFLRGAYEQGAGGLRWIPSDGEIEVIESGPLDKKQLQRSLLESLMQPTDEAKPVKERRGGAIRILSQEGAHENCRPRG